MPQIPSGSVIRRLGARNEPGVAGCLVRFSGDTEKLFWLTAGHVVVSSDAAQFDPIEALGLPGETIGRLYGWTSLDGEFTVDAALVWVDPHLVLPEIQGLGVPGGINAEPEIDSILRIFVKGQVRNGTIKELAADLEVPIIGPDFNKNFIFRNQIICDGFNTADCSGAIAVDDNGLVVGIVVAGGEKTAITPIGEILGHPDWGLGDPLQLATEVPETAIPPVVPPPKPVPLPAPSSTMEDALRAALRFNEIGDKTPYELCFAVKGKSGCSFGFMQGDLAAGPPIVRSTFRDALDAAGIPSPRIEDFTRRLSGALLGNPLTRADTQLINDALNAPRGRALVDAMDAAIFADKRHGLDLCIAKAEASGHRLVPEAQIQMLLWINMTGPPTILLDWISGNDIRFPDSGRAVTKPPPTIDAREMERYLRATKFFVENPRNLDHFQTAVQKGMALIGREPAPGAVARMPGAIAMAEVDESGTVGKKRDARLAPELRDLLGRAAAAAGVDKVFVTSGGQPGTRGTRVGGPRHDHGRAADLQLIVDGRTLTFTDRDGNPTIESFITAAASLGANGMGAGERYMGNRTIHVGFGKTPQDLTQVVWGADETHATAPRWLQQAAQRGWNSPVPPSPFATGDGEEEDQPA
jgi:hypothetical protein